MFLGPSIFNEYIGLCYTSYVTNIRGMFLGAKKFNQDISKWNTSKVIYK